MNFWYFSLLERCQFSSLSLVWLFATQWTAARQASLSITNSRSLLKFMSTESVMPSNHLILYHPFLPLPSTFPSIRIFSNESVLRIRWPKYWSAVGSVIIWEHPAQPGALLEGSREELVPICCPKGYVRVARRVRDQGRTGHSQQRRSDGFYREITGMWC